MTNETAPERVNLWTYVRSGARAKWVIEARDVPLASAQARYRDLVEAGDYKAIDLRIEHTDVVNPAG